MKFEYFEITKREILVTISITFILLALGLFIITTIENKNSEKNEKYYKALKINENEEKFKYAIDTNIGYTLVHGKVEAINSISIPDIEGNYFYISKTKEKYTMHTRLVAHRSGKTTYYTTEIYYTWDYAGEENFHIDKFKYLGKEFNYNDIEFNNMQYLTTKNVAIDTRYVYHIIPNEFEGSLFTNIQNNTITENTFYYIKSIDEIIKEKEDSEKKIKIIFWVLYIIFITGIDIAYIAAENRYLED